jgi:hypothetical protein
MGTGEGHIPAPAARSCSILSAGIGAGALCSITGLTVQYQELLAQDEDLCLTRGAIVEHRAECEHNTSQKREHTIRAEARASRVAVTTLAGLRHADEVLTRDSGFRGACVSQHGSAIRTESRVVCRSRTALARPSIGPRSNLWEAWKGENQMRERCRPTLQWSVFLPGRKECKREINDR